jgi:hypothetical protein
VNCGVDFFDSDSDSDSDSNSERLQIFFVVVFGHINNSDSISKIVSKTDVENFSELVYVLVFVLFVHVEFFLI